MARIALTERRIQALQPDPTGKRRIELRDSQVPGLVLRMRRPAQDLRAAHAFSRCAPPDPARHWASSARLPLTTRATLRANGSTCIRRGIDPAAERADARTPSAARARPSVSPTSAGSATSPRITLNAGSALSAALAPPSASFAMFWSPIGATSRLPK